MIPLLVVDITGSQLQSKRMWSPQVAPLPPLLLAHAARGSSGSREAHASSVRPSSLPTVRSLPAISPYSGSSLSATLVSAVPRHRYLRVQGRGHTQQSLSRFQHGVQFHPPPCGACGLPPPAPSLRVRVALFFAVFRRACLFFQGLLLMASCQFLRARACSESLAAWGGDRGSAPTGVIGSKTGHFGGCFSTL